MFDPSQLGSDRIRPLRRVEFDRLVELGVFDEDEHIELLRGWLVAMSPQGAAHAGIITRLTMILAPALVGRAEIRVQLPLALSEDSEPEPDFAVVPSGNYTAAHPTRALLVIEISDSSVEKDRGLKAPLYAEADVPEYWIVNISGRSVEVYDQPAGGAYGRSRILSDGDTVNPGAFPDLSVSVARILP